MKRMVLLSAALLLSFNVTAYAAEAKDCAINYVRTACAGKEAESYKKCDGKQSCTKAAEAKTVQECQDLAVKACANDRLDITKSKVITASFKGSALKSKSGKEDFCSDYANRDKEFNRCP